MTFRQHLFSLSAVGKDNDVRTSQLIKIGFAGLIDEIMNNSELKSIFKIQYMAIMSLWPHSDIDFYKGQAIEYKYRL